jgi:hypothetical protein
MATPYRKRVRPVRKFERLFMPISVHLTASAAAKVAVFSAAG